MDSDGDPLEFHWSVVSGPAGGDATLSVDNTMHPVLSATVPGDYEIELVVDDGYVPSFADTTIVEFCTDEDQDGVCVDQDIFGVDCDDADPLVYSDAPEVNDGLDQQCPGDPGFGLIDEIPGLASFGQGPDNTVDREQFHWFPQTGARLYQVVRSDRADFTSVCTLVTTPDRYWVDPDPPPPGQVQFYMTRAFTPHAGSWGVDSEELERTLSCGNTDHVFVFMQDDNNNIDASALGRMLDGIVVETDDYIMFRIRSPFFGDPNWEVATCMERADWYRDRYLESRSSGIHVSGVWQKWWRVSEGDTLWSGPDSRGYTHRYGNDCFESSSWCVADRLGGIGELGVRPGASSCEAYYEPERGCGSDWQLTIKIAGDRQAACGF